MSQFDSKTFNPEVFGKYLEIIPRTTRNELIKSGALALNNKFKELFAPQTGAYKGTLPFFGRIGSSIQNYDGQTNIEPQSSQTYSQSYIVIGRAGAWIEKDFSADITGGVDFMDNVAKQVADYWDDAESSILLKILSAIFGISSTFATKHTYDITGNATAADAKFGATTLNSALQQAVGDNKSSFSLAIMHSVVATNLENLNLVDRLKYTDASGIQRDLQLATLNGRLVLIDDNCPEEEIDAVNAVSAVSAVPAVYTITIATKAVAGDSCVIKAGGVEKSYICGSDWSAGADVAADCTNLQAVIAADFPLYTVTKTTSTIVLTQKTALAEDAATITVYKLDETGTFAATIAETKAGVTGVTKVDAADAYTRYTTYVFGKGSIEYCDVGAEEPVEMVRDALTNGGQNTLVNRRRFVFAPKGFSFTGSTATDSPTDVELALSSNWDIVNNGKLAGDKVYIDHKAIAIARILSKG